MKKLLLITLLIATSLVTTNTFAELAQASIKSEFDSKKAQMQAESQTLVDLQKNYQRDFDALSDDQKRAKLEEINTKRRAFVEKENKMLNELNKKRNDKLLEFQKTLMTQVNSIAQELGYDLIVGEGVLYASPTVDITDKVLARLR